MYGFVLSAASVGTGRPFLSQDCGKLNFLELLCTRCEAFGGSMSNYTIQIPGLL